jgi:hypothetical protein
MTLKQWLSSMALPNRENVASEIAALTAAYYQDQAHKAEDAFNKAFLKLQGELPIIDEKGQIEYRDGRTGTYALNEDIQDAILPFLQKHGFTLHFESVDRTSVDGVLTHKRGHSRRSRFTSDADLTGGKTVAQARGSVLSYGHRYCTIDLLNLVTRGIDNDGASAGFKFAFDPSQLPSAEAKATFKCLMEAALDDTLDECWKGLDTNERASVGFECLQYVKQLAGYVR